MSDPVRRFVSELRRRRVFRVAVVYAAVCWALIQIADAVATPLSLPPWFTTFVIVVAALGLPIALVLAWAFDVSPAGDAAGAEAAARPSARTSWALTAAFVLLVVAAPLLFRTVSGSPATGESDVDTDGIESIAVLPFVNMSSDQENEHFSDGLAEELLNALAQIPGLRVAARTSSFVFKGDTDRDIAEIGRRLNVETVLEGSVRKAGNTVRITAQLVKTADGYHLWSKVYRRELQDIFEIQDEIAAAIVEALGPRFSGALTQPAEHATENVEAYELYLRGRHRFWQGSSEKNLRDAAELFQQAVDEDPSFGPAWAGLSDAYMLLAGQVRPREVMPMATRAAQRALEADPRLAEGYVALASINWLYDWDWSAADQNYRLSFSVNPLLHTRCICYAWYLATVGNTQAAVVEAERAREMDPLARLPHVILAWMYYLADRPADALTEIDEVFTTTPEDMSSHRIRAWILWDEGRRDDAIEVMHGIRDRAARNGSFEESGPPMVIAELAVMYAAAGWGPEAVRLSRALRARAGRGYVPPEYVAAAQAAAGDLDAAFASMDEAVANRSNLGQFSILPVSRALRSDARYGLVLERIGLGVRIPQLVSAPAVTALGDSE